MGGTLFVHCEPSHPIETPPPSLGQAIGRDGRLTIIELQSIGIQVSPQVSPMTQVENVAINTEQPSCQVHFTRETRFGGLSTREAPADLSGFRIRC